MQVENIGRGVAHQTHAQLVFYPESSHVKSVNLHIGHVASAAGAMVTLSCVFPQHPDWLISAIFCWHMKDDVVCVVLTSVYLQL